MATQRECDSEQLTYGNITQYGRSCNEHQFRSYRNLLYPSRNVNCLQDAQNKMIDLTEKKARCDDRKSDVVEDMVKKNSQSGGVRESIDYNTDYIQYGLGGGNITLLQKKRGPKMLNRLVQKLPWTKGNCAILSLYDFGALSGHEAYRIQRRLVPIQGDSGLNIDAESLPLKRKYYQIYPDDYIIDSYGINYEQLTYILMDQLDIGNVTLLRIQTPDLCHMVIVSARDSAEVGVAKELFIIDRQVQRSYGIYPEPILLYMRRLGNIRTFNFSLFLVVKGGFDHQRDFDFSPRRKSPVRSLKKKSPKKVKKSPVLSLKKKSPKKVKKSPVISLKKKSPKKVKKSPVLSLKKKSPKKVKKSPAHSLKKNHKS